MEAERLDVLRLVLEEDGARHASGFEVGAEHASDPLRASLHVDLRLAHDRFVVAGLALERMPRLEDGHQARVRNEVLRAARLRLEARERTVIEVGVLPPQREQAPFALAGVRGERVEHTPRERDAAASEERHDLAGVEEAERLFRVGLRTEVLPYRVRPLASKAARKLRELEESMQPVVLLDARLRAMVRRLRAHDRCDVVARDVGHGEITERRAARSSRADFVDMRGKRPRVDLRASLQA